MFNFAELPVFCPRLLLRPLFSFFMIGANFFGAPLTVSFSPPSVFVRLRPIVYFLELSKRGGYVVVPFDLSNAAQYFGRPPSGLADHVI